MFTFPGHAPSGQATGRPAERWLRRPPHHILVAIVVMFLATNVGRLAWTGVRTGADSSRYTAGAATLLEGRALVGVSAAYAGYIGVVALCDSVRIGLIGLVLLQIVIAAAALIAVYRLGVGLSGPLAGLLAAALFTCDIDTNRWHAFVLTDSLYLSAVAITVWLVHRATESSAAEWGRYLTAILAVGITALIRPEGRLIVPIAAIYLVVRGRSAVRLRRIAAVAIALVSAFVILLIGSSLRGSLTMNPGELLVRGATISDYEGWRLSMPPPAAASTRPIDPPTALIYAARHPVKTAILILARLVVAFGQVRPFYSTAHNVGIVLWLAPIYAFGLRGWGLRRRQPLARWCAVVIAVHASIVGLTYADWDGRFLAHILPLIYVFTACGAVQMMQHRSSSLAA